MSDATRLTAVREALLKWLYAELLAGRHTVTLPALTPSSAGWPDPLPNRLELEAAAAWLSEKGYAAKEPGRPTKFHITPSGETVASSPGGIRQPEQPVPEAPAPGTIYNVSGSRINVAHHSSGADQKVGPDGDPGNTATWTGSIAGVIGVLVAVIGVVVALLAWSPWQQEPKKDPTPTTSLHSAGTTSSAEVPAAPTTTAQPAPFTVAIDRDLEKCGPPHLFGQDINELGPPPDSDNAWPAWIRAHSGIDTSAVYPDGTVASKLYVTIKGRNQSPVTLTGLYVEVVSRSAGGIVGTSVRAPCGGSTDARYAEFNLDTSPPALKTDNGPSDASTVPMKFPYHVTDTDTELFYILARTANYVQWRLHLQWSNGVDSGDYVVDEHGSPLITAKAAPGTQYYKPTFNSGLSAWEHCPDSSEC